MHYEEFRAQWRKAMDDAAESRLTDGSAEVARLRKLTEQITDAYERRSAEAAVQSLAEVLSYESEPVSDEVAEAYRISAWANNKGEPAEWIARIDEAMRRIGELADHASDDDESEILDLNEPLAMLLDAVRGGGRIPRR